MNYYALLVALVLVTALMMHGTRAGNKKYIIVASLLLFSVYGLRSAFAIGADTSSSYLRLFRSMPSYSWSDLLHFEFRHNAVYTILNKVFYELSGGDYQLFVTAIAGFVSICFGRLLYRFSSNPLQSILYHFGLLFFTLHFNILKQSIAMAFLMLAFEAIVDRKPIRFLLLTLIATQFHFPALIFLPAYWIAMIRPGRSYLLFLAITLIAVYLFRNTLVNLMLDAYKGREEIVNLNDTRFLRTKAVIMIVIVIAAVLFRKPRAEDRVYSILLEFMGMAIIFQTFCGYNNIFERLADYYFQFSVIFIPMVFDKNADREPLLAWRFISVADSIAPFLFCGFAIYRFITTTMGNHTLYPFRFFFQS